MTPAQSWVTVGAVVLAVASIAGILVWLVWDLFTEHYANDGEFKTDYCAESKKPGCICFCNQCNRARNERIKNGHFYCRSCGVNQVTSEGAQCIECFRAKGLFI